MAHTDFLAPPSTRRGPVRPRRVLVVDDNIEAADTLAAALHYHGYDVRVCYDGHEGLAAASEYEPDVAIWDITMPRLDGFAAAKLLREQANGRRILLVALTGLPEEESSRRALLSGFDVHLKKPIDFHQLIETVGVA
jgi:DNA-binding response OmpR family regulator